jgi:hypothetical protein
MSMYTELLHAALEERGPVVPHPTMHSALHALRRRRGELDEGTSPVTDPDAVPVVLAREVAYDLALVDVAELMGIETALHRFGQPRQERARLEMALLDSGVAARSPLAARPADLRTRDGAVRYRWPRCATPGSIAR